MEIVESIGYFTHQNANYSFISLGLILCSLANHYSALRPSSGKTKSATPDRIYVIGRIQDGYSIILSIWLRLVSVQLFLYIGREIKMQEIIIFLYSSIANPFCFLVFDWDMSTKIERIGLLPILGHSSLTLLISFFMYKIIFMRYWLVVKPFFSIKWLESYFILDRNVCLIKSNLLT